MFHHNSKCDVKNVWRKHGMLRWKHLVCHFFMLAYGIFYVLCGSHKVDKWMIISLGRCLTFDWRKFVAVLLSSRLWGVKMVIMWKGYRLSRQNSILNVSIKFFAIPLPFKCTTSSDLSQHVKNASIKKVVDHKFSFQILFLSETNKSLQNEYKSYANFPEIRTEKNK